MKKPQLLAGQKRIKLAFALCAITLPLACQSEPSDDDEEGSGGSAGDPQGSGGKSSGDGGRASGGRASSTGGAQATGGAKASGGDHAMAGSSAGGQRPGSGGSATGGKPGLGGEGGAVDPVEPCAGLLSEEECSALSLFSPLGSVPDDPTNAYADDAGAAELGQMFFFDTEFSGPLAANSDLGDAGEVGKVACVSCHASSMMSDDRSPNSANVSLGANFHSRNAPGLVNSSFYLWTNWGGRFSRQWELPMPVTESGVIMNSSRLQVAHVIYEKYAEAYDAVFGDEFGPLSDAIATMPATGKPSQPEWENLDPTDKEIVLRVFVNYAKSLAAYTRRLVSGDSRFDRFAAGDYGALSSAEVRGFQVFLGPGGCASCHSGSHFSDDGFHNIGVAQSGPNVPAVDNGRIGDLPVLLSSTLSGAGAYSDDPTFGQAMLTPLDATNEAQRGSFRTPTLRGVEKAGPYMHAGQLATLEDVVAFYDRGGDTPSVGAKTQRIVPLGLSARQKADLVAFLKSLTGEPVPAALLEDTSF